MPELRRELLHRRIHKRLTKLLLHQVDRATAETATHHTRTTHIHLPRQLVQEIQLLTTHLIQLAHAEMRLIHHLTSRLIIPPLQRITHIQHPLHLTDHILRTQEILLRNLRSHLLQPYALRIAQELHLRMVLTDRRRRILTRLPTLVVRR